MTTNEKSKTRPYDLTRSRVSTRGVDELGYVILIKYK